MRFPIWFVVRDGEDGAPKSIPCDAAGAGIGFTMTNRLISFLETERECTLSLASDADELFLLVADLHKQGASQLCLDPDTDGLGGRVFSLDDVLLFAEQERDASAARWRRRLAK